MVGRETAADRIAKGEYVPFAFGVKNISDQNVTIVKIGQSPGIRLFSLSDSGERTLIFPTDGNPAAGSNRESQVLAREINHRSGEVIAPGVYCIYEFNIPAKVFGAKEQRMVASVRQVMSGNVSKIYDAFSEPFTLPLPPGHRSFKISAELDKEPKGDIPKLMVPIVLTISNESSEDAVFVSDRYDTHGVNVYSVEKSGEKILVYPPDESAIGSSTFLEVKAGKSNYVKAEIPMNILEKYKTVVFSIWTKGSNGVFLGEEIYSTPFTLPALN
jgi:hypothetical protein